MEQNKYYQPDINEFRVGFEYEYLEHFGKDWGNWNEYEVKADDSLYHLSQLLLSRAIRVKYLDDKDIEECGFTCLEVPEASDRKWSDEYVFVHKVMSNRYLRYNIVTHGMLTDNNRNMENHIRWFDSPYFY